MKIRYKDTKEEIKTLEIKLAKKKDWCWKRRTNIVGGGFGHDEKTGRFIETRVMYALWFWYFNFTNRKKDLSETEHDYFVNELGKALEFQE